MNVQMIDSLAGGTSGVESDVEPVGTCRSSILARTTSTSSRMSDRSSGVASHQSLIGVVKQPVRDPD